MRAARAAGNEFPLTAPGTASGSAVDGGGITDGESPAGNTATGARNGGPVDAKPDDDEAGRGQVLASDRHRPDKGERRTVREEKD